MKSRHLATVAVAAICLVGIGAGCSSDDDPVTPPPPAPPLSVSGSLGPAGGTLTSSDGSMFLTVPAGALTTTQDVSITEVDPASVGTAYDGFAVTRVFNVMPTGLDFGSDAVWSLSLAWDPAPGKEVIVGGSRVATAFTREDLDSVPSVQRIPEQFLRLEPGVNGAIDRAEVTVHDFNADQVAIGTIPSVSPRTGAVSLSFDLGGPVSVEEFSVFAIETRMALDPELNWSSELTYDSYGTFTGVTPNLQDGATVIPFDAGTLADGSPYIDFAASFTAQEFTAAGGDFAYGVSFGYSYSPSLLEQFSNVDLPIGQLQVSIEYPAYQVSITADPGPGGAVAEGVWAVNMGGLEGFGRPLRVRWPYSDAVLGAGGEGVGIYSTSSDPPLTQVSSHLRGPGLTKYGAFAMRLNAKFKAPGDDRVAVISVGPTGGALTQWFPETDNFGFTLLFANGFNVTDGQPLDADPLGGSFLYVDNTNSRVFLQHYNIQTEFFDNEGPFATFPAATGQAVTAAARKNGSLLVVTDGAPGQLFLHDRASPFDDAVLVTTVGDSPRRLRVLGEIGVVSNFAAGTLTVFTWDAADNIAVRETIPVGDGPIGIDLVAIPGGQVGIVSTGFNDNSWSVTVVDAAGALVSNLKTTLPTNALAPGHAIWLDDEGNQVLISCNGSDNVVVIGSGL